MCAHLLEVQNCHRTCPNKPKHRPSASSSGLHLCLFGNVLPLGNILNSILTLQSLVLMYFGTLQLSYKFDFTTENYKCHQSVPQTLLGSSSSHTFGECSYLSENVFKWEWLYNITVINHTPNLVLHVSPRMMLTPSSNCSGLLLILKPLIAFLFLKR